MYSAGIRNKYSYLEFRACIMHYQEGKNLNFMMNYVRLRKINGENWLKKLSPKVKK